MNNNVLGRIGEEMAVRVLEAKGATILMRNYRCAVGEIDIIAKYGERLTFVEVKTRSGSRYGRPCEAVNERKQQRIKGAAVCFLRDNSYLTADYSIIGFDVMEISVNHMEAVF